VDLGEHPHNANTFICTIVSIFENFLDLDLLLPYKVNSVLQHAFQNIWVIVMDRVASRGRSGFVKQGSVAGGLQLTQPINVSAEQLKDR